jgi:CRISPR-associated endonuclease Csn1
MKKNPELAFSPEGIDEMNKNIVVLNKGKQHQPILKVRTYEPKGNKFNVGIVGNKINKYVESAKGTNLFFAIYVDEEGKRNYETIQLNIVIERLKQGLSEVPETNEKGEKLLFHLSPNDLVYVLSEEEILNGFKTNSVKDADRIYKMVSSSGSQCFFTPNNIASPIMQTTELGANNKSEKAWNGQMIKQTCIKLTMDRLGSISI